SSLSRKMFALLDAFTPVYEAVSIDEGYLDMTGTEHLWGPPMEAAVLLRARILKETQLTVSVGIASNRLVAKVASDYCKPDNLYWVKPGEEAAFLAPLEIKCLPGCGQVTQEWLHSQGVFLIRALQQFSLSTLERELGKFGGYLHDSAWGRGSTAFYEEAKARSLSRERTFDKNVADSSALKRNLWEMAAELGRNLREDEDFARVVRLKLRYPPFETVTRQRVLDVPTQRDSVIYEMLELLFEEHWNPGHALRLIGAGCVLNEGAVQLGLFEDTGEAAKQDTLDRMKDLLCKKFGDNALKTGRDL
ncbi:DNA polymerase IV, partial [Bdellovibrionota bacterium FG-2]